MLGWFLFSALLSSYNKVRPCNILVNYESDLLHHSNVLSVYLSFGLVRFWTIPLSLPLPTAHDEHSFFDAMGV
jgi:hypothetical protein